MWTLWSQGWQFVERAMRDEHSDNYSRGIAVRVPNHQIGASGNAGKRNMMTAQKNEKRVRDFAGETTDTIREYLTAIGQHPLLEKADEIRLGLAVERRMELLRRRGDFADEYGYQPSTIELTFDIYMALRELRKALLTFAGELGFELGEGATISEALAIAEVRDALDLPMNAALKSAMADALEVKEATR